MNQRLQQEVLRNFDNLPKTSYIRLPTIIVLYGPSNSTILRDIKKGNTPPPIKLTTRTTGWKVEDIRQNLKALLCQNGA